VANTPPSSNSRVCDLTLEWSDTGKTAGVTVRLEGQILRSATLKRFDSKGVVEYLKAVREGVLELKLTALSESEERDLRGQIETALADGPGSPFGAGLRYALTDSGLVLRTAFGDKPLCNFNAMIVSAKTIIRGDQDIQTVFEIATWIGSEDRDKGTHQRTVHIEAGKFRDLHWVIEQLGARAIVFAGPGIREHVAVAIQELSLASLKEVTVRGHTGWCTLDGKPYFLTAAGALGADGLSTQWGVELPEKLQRIRLDAPPNADVLRLAIRASLRCLAIAPWEVTLPLLCATYRAPLSENNQMLPMTGTSGSYKTSIGVTLLQHFGASHDSDKLPNWSSTSGANEALLYLAKDCLQVVDDFVPGEEGSKKLHAKSGRLIRSGANQTGRDRLDRSSRLQASSYYPRCFTLITGEESQRGGSVVARTWEVRMVRASVKLVSLSAAQRAGSTGALAQAMSGYIVFLARDNLIGKLDVKAERQKILDELLCETSLRNAKSVHARAPMNLADMLLGWRFFLNYAAEAGVLTEKAVAVLWKRGRDILVAQLTGQSTRQVAASAADTFLRIARQLIQSQRAHLTRKSGSKPTHPEKFGYRDTSTATGAIAFWAPSQACIGFVDEDASEVFLYPDVAFGEVQRLGHDTGSKIEFQLEAVKDQLLERGLLIPDDRGDGKERPLTRIRMEKGQRPSFMRMKLTTLLGEQDAADGDAGAQCEDAGATDGSEEL
jgi:hypothetical protein